MAVLHFNEEDLKEILLHLPLVRTAAFAASCAGRLARDVGQLESSSEVDQILTEAGLALWEWVCSGRILDSKPFEARLMEVMPDEFDEGDFTSAVVEDATASMIYALRTRCPENAQNAAWAARRVYETTERHASQFINDLEYGGSAETQILQNPVVQLELSRQARDLSLLQSSQTDADIFSELRTNANCERVFYYELRELR